MVLEDALRWSVKKATCATVRVGECNFFVRQRELMKETHLLHSHTICQIHVKFTVYDIVR